MDYRTLVSVNHSLLLTSHSFKANLILISNCISHFQRDVLLPLALPPSEPGGFLAALPGGRAQDTSFLPQFYEAAYKSASPCAAVLCLVSGPLAGRSGFPNALKPGRQNRMSGSIPYRPPFSGFSAPQALAIGFLSFAFYFLPFRGK